MLRMYHFLWSKQMDDGGLGGKNMGKVEPGLTNVKCHK